MNVRVAMRMEKAIPPLVRATASIAKYIIKPPINVANRANSIVVFKRSSIVICSGDATWYVTKSGELYGCGYGTFGQQGSGLTDVVKVFTKRADNVAQVACSEYTTWYVTKSGELYGCGRGDFGQQGSGATDNVKVFTKRADDVAQAVCHDAAIFYISKSGNLYYSGFLGGYDYVSSSGTPDGATTFSLLGSNIKGADGAYSSSVQYDDYMTTHMGVAWYLTNSGELFGMGYGIYGQQGNGSTDNVTTFTKRA